MNHFPITPIRAKYADELTEGSRDRKKLDTLPVALNVSDVKELTTAQCNSLKCGDIVTKEDSTGKHAYIVTFKKDGTGMCLTYADGSGYIETVSYDLTGDEWVYNSTDVFNAEDYAKKSEIPPEAIGFDGEVTIGYTPPFGPVSCTDLANYTEDKAYCLRASGYNRGVIIYRPVNSGHGYTLILITSNMIYYYLVDPSTYQFTSDSRAAKYNEVGTKWYKHTTVIKTANDEEYTLECISTNGEQFTSINPALRAFENGVTNEANIDYISLKHRVTYQGQQAVIPSYLGASGVANYNYFNANGPYEIVAVTKTLTADLSTGNVTVSESRASLVSVSFVSDTVTAL